MTRNEDYRTERIEVIRENWWNAYERKAELREDFIRLFASSPCEIVALTALIDASVDFGRIDERMTRLGILPGKPV